jgi:hypothetical protein
MVPDRDRGRSPLRCVWNVNFFDFIALPAAIPIVWADVRKKDLTQMNADKKGNKRI